MGAGESAFNPDFLALEAGPATARSASAHRRRVRPCGPGSSRIQRAGRALARDARDSLVRDDSSRMPEFDRAATD